MGEGGHTHFSFFSRDFLILAVWRCGIETRIITTYDEFLQLRDPWGELHGQVKGSLFQVHDWLARWWKYYGEKRNLSIPTFWKDGLLVGVIPGCREVKRLGPVSFNRFSLLGEEEAYGEYAPLVEAGSIQEVVPLAVSMFARDLQSGGLDAIDFHGFSPDLEFMTAFASLLGARVHVRHVRQNQPHSVVEGAASGEMYLKMMSNRRRRTLRRQERLLSEAGAEIEVVNTWDGGTPFEDLVRLHTARWARDGQPGRFGSQRFAQFLRDVTEVLMPLGQARIYFTRVGAERIAGLLVFDVQRQNYQYLVGRDPMHTLMRYSVGEVLAMRATMDAFDEGSIVCDMMGGDYHHKHYTGMTKRWYSRLTAVASGWKRAKGHLYCGALATRDKVGHMSQVLNHARSDTTRESKVA